MFLIFTTHDSISNVIRINVITVMIFTVIAAILTMIVFLILSFWFEAAVGAHVWELPAPAGSVNQVDWTLAHPLLLHSYKESPAPEKYKGSSCPKA